MAQVISGIPNWVLLVAVAGGGYYFFIYEDKTQAL